MKSAAKRVAVEALGWILVLVGIAALVLPGPGLLALFAGVALLATQYEWAERRLEPVQEGRAARRRRQREDLAAHRTLGLGVLWLIGFGVLWIVQPRGARPGGPSTTGGGWWAAGRPASR